MTEKNQREEQEISKLVSTISVQNDKSTLLITPHGKYNFWKGALVSYQEINNYEQAVSDQLNEIFRAITNRDLMCERKLDYRFQVVKYLENKNQI